MLATCAKQMTKVMLWSTGVRISSVILGVLYCGTEKRRLTLCVGCGSQIHDQYILRVAPSSRDPKVSKFISSKYL